MKGAKTEKWRGQQTGSEPESEQNRDEDGWWSPDKTQHVNDQDDTGDEGEKSGCIVHKDNVYREWKMK
jgi:hypothetical protein